MADLKIDQRSEKELVAASQRVNMQADNLLINQLMATNKQNNSINEMNFDYELEEKKIAGSI